MGENLSQSQKNKGQYFTPLNIVKSIVKLTLDHVKFQELPLKILDPATGEGIFVQEVINLFKQKFDLIHAYTLDIDPIVLKEAQSRLLPFTNEKIKIEFCLKNFLTQNFQEEKSQFFDLIIGNPPHNAKYDKQEWKIIRGMDQRYITDKVPSESAIFFVLKSLLLLREGGILSFILPKPFCYSNKWKSFRELCLSKFCLLAVFDLANQFSGQLQEQMVIILKKSSPQYEFHTGVWNQSIEKMDSLSRIQTRVARQADNFLVSITPEEHKLIEKLFSKCKPIDWNAFRGLSSEYRTNNVGTPLVEKAIITNGFLLPPRSYLKSEIPTRLTKRILQPKIICQRIISYSTKPIFQLFIPVFIDVKGEHLTHETVINIIPSLIPGIGLYSYGALLHSELISWWLQQAVYTKHFVTSKDLDNPYLRKLLLPIFESNLEPEFLKTVEKNLSSMSYKQNIAIVRNQTKLVQFFTIGELYKIYQHEGKHISKILCEMQGYEVLKSATGSDVVFKRVKRLNNLFMNTRFEDIRNMLDLSPKVEKMIQQAVLHYSNQKKIISAINEIVYMMYDISLEEKKLINGGGKINADTEQ